MNWEHCQRYFSPLNKYSVPNNRRCPRTDFAIGRIKEFKELLQVSTVSSSQKQFLCCKCYLFIVSRGLLITDFKIFGAMGMKLCYNYTNKKWVNAYFGDCGNSSLKGVNYGLKVLVPTNLSDFLMLDDFWRASDKKWVNMCFSLC